MQVLDSKLNVSLNTSHLFQLNIDFVYLSKSCNIFRLISHSHSLAISQSLLRRWSCVFFTTITSRLLKFGISVNQEDDSILLMQKITTGCVGTSYTRNLTLNSVPVDFKSIIDTTLSSFSRYVNSSRQNPSFRLVSIVANMRCFEEFVHQPTRLFVFQRKQTRLSKLQIC